MKNRITTIAFSIMMLAISTSSVELRAAGAVTELKQADDLARALQNDGITVVKFHASWCGACKGFASTYDALAGEYPNVNFVKIDADKIQTPYQIQAYPTFKIFKNGKQVGQDIKGGDRQGIIAIIEKNK